MATPVALSSGSNHACSHHFLRRPTGKSSADFFGSIMTEKTDIVDDSIMIPTPNLDAFWESRCQRSSGLILTFAWSISPPTMNANAGVNLCSSSIPTFPLLSTCPRNVAIRKSYFAPNVATASRFAGPIIDAGWIIVCRSSATSTLSLNRW